MVKLTYIEPIWYIKADETVQTCIINKDNVVINVVYVHYKNGYYSYIFGLDSLMNFLNGDVNERRYCSDNTEDFENLITELLNYEEA